MIPTVLAHADALLHVHPETFLAAALALAASVFAIARRRRAAAAARRRPS
jgi:hypothetical protein